MHFLHDTHYGTMFPNFFISRPKMEMKTCQFGTISDSATRSTSCRRFFGIRFGCREINVSNKQKIRQWWSCRWQVLPLDRYHLSRYLPRHHKYWIYNFLGSLSIWNEFPRKSTVLSNSLVIPFPPPNIILLICMISWSQLITPSRYLNFCTADTEYSGPRSSIRGNFYSSNSTRLSKVNQLSLWYFTLMIWASYFSFLLSVVLLE